MKLSKSHLSCTCLAATLLLLASGEGTAGELQVQQIAPDRRATDCTGKDCAVDTDMSCVPGAEGDLPDICPDREEDSDEIVGDGLIPRVEDPQGGAGIPLIPGVTINQ